jgi:hypothetical protein
MMGNDDDVPPAERIDHHTLLRHVVRMLTAMAAGGHEEHVAAMRAGGDGEVVDLVADEADVRLVLDGQDREERAEWVRWVRQRRGDEAAERVERMARQRWRAIVAAQGTPPPRVSGDAHAQASALTTGERTTAVPGNGSFHVGPHAGDSTPVGSVVSGVCP